MRKRKPYEKDIVAIDQTAHHLPGRLSHRVEEEQVGSDQDVLWPGLRKISFGDSHLGVLLRDGDLGSVDELEEGGEGVRVEVLQHDLRVL